MTELKFKDPTFSERIRGMLGVDFYRLFHTPMFYIFLAIAAIIPAMVSAMTMMPDPSGNTMEPLYSNVWQIIAATEPLYVIRTIADYANMNMVFIFGGIMVSIFIGHDYKSGYVKQLFTTHAKKQDYMISKSLVCAFAMACMCVTYLIGGTVGGLLAGYSLEVVMNPSTAPASMSFPGPSSTICTPPFMPYLARVSSSAALIDEP